MPKTSGATSQALEIEECARISPFVEGRRLEGMAFIAAVVQSAKAGGVWTKIANA